MRERAWRRASRVGMYEEMKKSETLRGEGVVAPGVQAAWMGMKTKGPTVHHQMRFRSWRSCKCGKRKVCKLRGWTDGRVAGIEGKGTYRFLKSC